MIMNALNVVWSDIYFLKIIIQQELEQLTKILQENLILKFPVKARDIHKVKKKIVLLLVMLIIKARKNIKSMRQKILPKGVLSYYS